MLPVIRLRLTPVELRVPVVSSFLRSGTLPQPPITGWSLMFSMIPIVVLVELELIPVAISPRTTPVPGWTSYRPGRVSGLPMVTVMVTLATVMSPHLTLMVVISQPSCHRLEPRLHLSGQEDDLSERGLRLDSLGAGGQMSEIRELEMVLRDRS